LLKGSPKVLLWSPAADAAFVAAKAALVAAVPLCHPAPKAVLSLSVDASDSHVGGVLQQQVGNGWKPLAFFSKKLAPAEVKYSTLLSLHNIHHPGIKATRRMVCASFCWPKMGLFVSALARNCLHCQKGKIHRHVSLQAAHIPVPVRRFSHIHVDLVGPLPRSSGYSYLFTLVDRTTRWPEAYPLSSITAADCAAALLQGWIQRFGVPGIITSDRGPQFTSALWSNLCSLLNISHTQTTAYHPQSNGLVERFHRRLKDALRARTAGADWFSHLPLVMLGIRTAWREDAEFSPAEAVFGSQLVLPGQFLNSPEPPSPSFLSDFQGVLAARSPLQTAHHATPLPAELPEELLLSRFVLIRHDGVQPPLSPLYDGPFLVLERSLHFFKVQIGSRVETVSTHRLKPCHAPREVQAAEPPRRGRPPNNADAAKGSVSRQPTKTSPTAPNRRRRVTFACPLPTSKSSPPLRPPPAPPDRAARLRRSTARPARYTA
jgi:hypothetical protein